MNTNFSQRYDEGTKEGTLVFLEQDHLKISEIGGHKCIIWETDDSRTRNLGPIDEVARKILKNSERTILDVQIAQRLATLLEKASGPIGTIKSIKSIFKRSLSDQLRDVNFSQVYQNSPQEAYNFLKTSKVEIKEIPGKLVRHLYIEEKDLGPVDAFANQILRNKKRSALDMKIAHELSKAYRALEAVDRDLETNVYNAIRGERIGFAKALQTIVCEDFLGTLQKTDQYGQNRKFELEKIYESAGSKKFKEISEKTAREGSKDINIWLKNPEGVLENKTITVREDYTDSLQRGLSSQLESFFDFTEFSEEIIEQGMLEKIRGHKTEMVALMNDPESQEQLTEAKALYYDTVAEIFLMDLYKKLGPSKENFIPSILLFLEQTFTGYVASQLNAHLSSPQDRPESKSTERMIKIHPDRVELQLVFDQSKTYYDENNEIQTYPFGVRATLMITLFQKEEGDNEIPTRMQLTAEKLEDTSKAGNGFRPYPISVISSLQRQESGISFEDTTTLESSSND